MRHKIQKHFTDIRKHTNELCTNIYMYLFEMYRSGSQSLRMSSETSVLQRHVVLRSKAGASLEHVFDAGALACKRVHDGGTLRDLQGAVRLRVQG